MCKQPESNAGRLHRYDWLDLKPGSEEDSFNPDEFIIDAQISRLLIENVDKVLRSVPEMSEFVMRSRFGLDDGRQRTLKEVGETVDPSLSPGKVGQLIERGFRMLGHSFRLGYLKPFQTDKTAEEIEKDLSSLPPLPPYFGRQPS